MEPLNAQDYGDVLKLIDRALKAAPQPGGIGEHYRCFQLIQKLQQLHKAARDGEDVPAGN